MLASRILFSRGDPRCIFSSIPSGPCPLSGPSAGNTLQCCGPKTRGTHTTDFYFFADTTLGVVSAFGNSAPPSSHCKFWRVEERAECRTRICLCMRQIFPSLGRWPKIAPGPLTFPLPYGLGLQTRVFASVSLPRIEVGFLLYSILRLG